MPQTEFQGMEPMDNSRLNNDDFSNIGPAAAEKFLCSTAASSAAARVRAFDGAQANDFAPQAEKPTFMRKKREENRRPRKMKRISDDEWRGETKKLAAIRKNVAMTRKKPSDAMSARKAAATVPWMTDATSDRERNAAATDRAREALQARRRKRSYGPREERRDFKPGGEKRSYGPRERRRDFKPRGERREDDRGNRREYERRDDRRGSGRDARIAKPQGPKISADKEHIISPVHFRSRKKNHSDSED